MDFQQNWPDVVIEMETCLFFSASKVTIHTTPQSVSRYVLKGNPNFLRFFHIDNLGRLHVLGSINSHEISI